ncbi:Aminopeptidase N precursor [Reticulomyxa filosa]|uniref:Aminopeptidase N n=1 Tax=Reticulomyxa filosa TaxID=46433 RepID=X6LAP6_RETFI|nr:Aminopeptidase N precursor [Reticulomyxa filosa]|eukprot:ETN97799.1 Aminopeptidase N precursor [Reticulomyxa filosa]
MWDLFVVYSFAMAFELDGMTTSHPIEVEVQTAEQADEVFDPISYAKGASLVRMLQVYLGDDVFRKGLTKYLNNFRYSNAKTIDLWDFLGKEMKAPVGTIMRNWTKEQGFPLVTGVRSDDKLILTQIRHLSSGTLTKEQEKIVWNIPMKLRIGNETITVLFEKKKQIVDLPKNTKWVHLNADSSGFYACQYDKTLMESLTHALRSGDKNLNLHKRAIPQATENLLNLIVSFENETAYSIWFTVLDAAQAVFHIINDDDVLAQQFKAFMRKVLLTVFKKIDWQGDKDEDEETHALLRPLILSEMSRYCYQPVIDEALKRFKAFMNLKYVYMQYT